MKLICLDKTIKGDSIVLYIPFRYQEDMAQVRPLKRKSTYNKSLAKPASKAQGGGANLLPCRVQRTYQCQECDLVTRNPRDYLYHLRDDHGEKLKVFECDQCIYASRRPQKLQRHIGFIHSMSSSPLAKSTPKQRKGLAGKQVAAKKGGRRRATAAATATAQVEAKAEDPATVDDDDRDCNDNDHDCNDNINDCDENTGRDTDDHCHVDVVHDTMDNVEGDEGERSDNSDDVDKDVSHSLDGEDLVICDDEDVDCEADKEVMMEGSSCNGTEFDAERAYKDLAFKCSMCHFQSKSKVVVQRHEKVAHLKRKFFRCVKCGYMTSKRGRYTRHLRYHNLPSIKCEMCDFNTPYKWNLDRHLKNHNVEAIHRCTKCSFAANTMQSLTVHILNHHREGGSEKNSFLAGVGLVGQPSEVSNARQEGRNVNGRSTKRTRSTKVELSSQPELQNGESEANPSEFYQKYGRWYRRVLSCNKCNFSTTSANELQEHGIQHQQEAAEEESGSVISGNAPIPARQRLNLRARNLLRKVSKDVPSDSSPRRGASSKPLKCKSCSYEAKWMSELVRHNRIHTQEKPFVCPFCGFRSRWKGDMTRHVQKYHNELADSVQVDPDDPEMNGPKPKRRRRRKQQQQEEQPKDELTEPLLTGTLDGSTSDHLEESKGSPLEAEEDASTKMEEEVDEDEEELLCEGDLGPDDKEVDDEDEPIVDTSGGHTPSSLQVLRKCYCCPHCNFTASTASRFHVHIVAHLNQRPFMCSDCGYRSNWQWDVTKHIRLKSNHGESHTGATMVMVNEFAHRNYESYNKYIIYENNPVSEEGRNNSPTVKDSPERPKVEESSTNQKRHVVWKCIQCAYKSSSKQGILYHLPLHATDRPFFCGECGQSSKWRSIIENHCHTRHGNLLCIIENKKAVVALEGELEPEENAYDDTSEREGFVKEVATEGYVMPPVNDGSTMPYITTMKTTAKGETMKRHVCKLCPYQAKKLFDMRMHLRQHKPEPGAIFKCMFCPFYTSLRRSLLNHMKWHVNEPQEYIFKAMQSSQEPEPNEGNVATASEPKEQEEPPPTVTASSSSQPETKTVSPTVGEGEAAMFVSVQMKRYSCEHCPYTSNSKTQYLYHKQFHRTTKSGPFKCPHCNYSVTKSHLLLQHLKLHKRTPAPPAKASKVVSKPSTTPTKVEANEEVSVGSPKLPKLSMVIQTTAVEGATTMTTKNYSGPKKQPIPLVWSSKGGTMLRMFKCRFCPHVNKRRSNIREHEKMHRKRKVGRYNCPHCTYMCNNQGVLGAHVKVHQEEEGNAAPSIVEIPDAIEVTAVVPQTMEEQTPKQNAKVPHAKGPVFVCGMCPAQFVRPRNVEVHRRFHGASLAWKCKHCDFAARHRPHLHRHSKVHLPDYPEWTKPAKVESPQSSTVGAEIPVKIAKPKWEPKKHSCDLCPAAFLKLSSLSYHISLHGGNGKFKCHHCNYAVRNCGNLVRHTKIHDAVSSRVKSPGPGSPRLEKRRLTCHQCPATFDKYSRYDVHLKLHGSNQRFTCKYCDYSVKFMANLLKHQKMHEECLPKDSSSSPITMSNVMPSTPDRTTSKPNKTTPSSSSPQHQPPRLSIASAEMSVSEQQMLMLLQHQQQMVQQQRLGEDAKRLFYCDRCPYQHSRKDAVLSHLKRHRDNHGDQETTCLYCDYSTTLSSFLREHTKLHFQPPKRQRIESYLKWEEMDVWMATPNGESSVIFKDRGGSSEPEEIETTPDITGMYQQNLMELQVSDSDDDKDQDKDGDLSVKEAVVDTVEVVSVCDEVCAKVVVLQEKEAEEGNVERSSKSLEDEEEFCCVDDDDDDDETNGADISLEVLVNSKGSLVKESTRLAGDSSGSLVNVEVELADSSGGTIL